MQKIQMSIIIMGHIWFEYWYRIQKIYEYFANFVILNQYMKATCQI
jgi:hypothetical protein